MQEPHFFFCLMHVRDIPYSNHPPNSVSSEVVVPDQHHLGSGNNCGHLIPTLAEPGPSNLGLRTLPDLQTNPMRARVWKLLIYKSGNQKC